MAPPTRSRCRNCKFRFGSQQPEVKSLRFRSRQMIPVGFQKNDARCYKCDYSSPKAGEFDGLFDLIKKEGNTISIYKARLENNRIVYDQSPTETFEILGAGEEELKGKLDADGDKVADPAIFRASPFDPDKSALMLRLSANSINKLIKKSQKDTGPTGSDVDQNDSPADFLFAKDRRSGIAVLRTVNCPPSID
jgi:hypothetical protein